MNKNITVFLLMLIFSTAALADGSKRHFYYEKEYQKVWCGKNQGKTEVILPDRARVDCVTSTHAIEFDFAEKWAESIGQSLYYGSVLNKKPGIVLIVENKDKDKKYINRIETIAKNQKISLWFMYPQDMKN